MPSLQKTFGQRPPQIEAMREYTNPQKKDKIYLSYGWVIDGGRIFL
jgi:hypothetical protein